MVQFKIASMRGRPAELIEKAMSDSGCIPFEFKTVNDTRILDVYVDIEDWREELIKQWAENQHRIETNS